jgi:DNA-binding NarL/FixJ family response regulator
MIGTLMGKRKKGSKKTEAIELLQLEISEIEELSALLMSRIDERIKKLKELEQRIDSKLSALESLLLRAESLEKELSEPLDNRYSEVITLASKGVKIKEIAQLLDLPEGEVELILNMQD